MRKSELEISVLTHRVAKGAEYLVEVVVSSTGLAIGDHGSTDDLNGTITSTVSTGHIGVEVVDGTNEGGVTELLVHVVSTRTGIVSQPNTIGLDGGISLVDLVGKDEKREHGGEDRKEREGQRRVQQQEMAKMSETDQNRMPTGREHRPALLCPPKSSPSHWKGKIPR